MSAGEVLQVQERRLGPQDGMSCRETWAFLPWTCLSMFTPIILHTRVVCAAVVTFYSSEWRGGGELQYGEKKLIVKITSIPAMMFRVPVEQEASMASSKQIKTYSTMNPFVLGCFKHGQGGENGVRNPPCLSKPPDYPEACPIIMYK